MAVARRREQLIISNTRRGPPLAGSGGTASLLRSANAEATGKPDTVTREGVTPRAIIRWAEPASVTNQRCAGTPNQMALIVSASVTTT